MSDQIVSTFKTFMLNQGGSPDRWYIGITKDINGRLHGDHRVDVNDPAWIYENAGSAATARRVEAHFLSLGCDGGVGGGDHESRFVYLYQKRSQTQP